MKFLRLDNRLWLLAVLLLAPLFSRAAIIEPSVPPRMVNDRAGILTAQQSNELEKYLVNLDNQTSNQIVIVTIPSLDGATLEDYAVQLFRKWGIGSKKNNNGVLLLVAVSDRKVKIEVGYGLEGAITDVMAKHIITDEIAPNFASGNYANGLSQAVLSLGKAANGEYQIKRPQDDDSDSAISWPAFIIIVVLLLVFIYFTRKSGIAAPMLYSSRGIGNFNSGNNWRGGGGSGGGGGFGGFGGGSSGGGGASGGW